MQILKRPQENLELDIPKIGEIGAKYEKNFLTKLGDLYGQLTGKSLNKDKIYDTIEILNKIRHNQEKTYLKALLFPEKVRGARIPTKFPTPSIAFTSTDTMLITTNSSGNFQLQWSPSMLLSSLPNTTVQTSFGTEIWLNVDNTRLNGYTVIAEANRSDYTAQSPMVNSFFSCLQAFRVVSACCIIQYVGSFQDTKGVLGGALDVQPGSSVANLNYTSFNNIDDKLYSQKTNPENGLKINYFPVDMSDSQFLQINKLPTENYLATHVRILAYGQSLPVSSQCIRVDFVKNCEGIPGPAGQDLLSTAYEVDYSESGDAFIKASKTMAGNFLATTTLDESKELEKIMKLPGNSYKTVINNARIEPKDNNKLEKLIYSEKNSNLDNSVRTESILKNPKEIKLQYK